MEQTLFTFGILFIITAVHANSFTPPLQLHACVEHAYSQQFQISSNGSVFSPSLSASGIGYCLTVVNYGSREGNQVTKLTPTHSTYTSKPDDENTLCTLICAIEYGII